MHSAVWPWKSTAKSCRKAKIRDGDRIEIVHALGGG
jgi:hypothetical protein